jgi:hypothetical protein
MSEALPAFLTVEEAGALLRIGRTKAYAMTAEWRATEGRSGLPVVDLGDVLRVPLKALEELAGGALDAALLRPTPKLKSVPEPVIDLTDTEPVIDLTDSEPVRPEPRPARRSRRQPTDQPGLFDLPPAS